MTITNHTSYGAVGDGDNKQIETHFESSTKHRGINNKDANKKRRRLVIGGLVTFFALVFGIAFISHAKKSKNNAIRYDHEDDNIDIDDILLDKNHDPNKQLFYHDQIVNHFDRIKEGASARAAKWSQRYYVSPKYFKGPGHPIFLVIGGEDDLEKMLYPFITEHLAKKFGAYVLEPEHRFYGPYQPLDHYPSNDELATLLTPQQAMADAIRIVQYIQLDKLGCSSDRSSDKYCPIITVGGSYPGFLSAMLRFVYPDIVDISYAASAPLRLYAQEVEQGEYYEKVTESADIASPGCSTAVKTTLLDIVDELLEEGKSKPFELLADEMGVCVDTIPDYITTNEMFKEELMMIVASQFANANMMFYPPTSPETDMYKSCQIFQQNSKNGSSSSSIEIMSSYFELARNSDDYNTDLYSSECFDMRSLLPDGPNATISSSDWTGGGGGNNGIMWDFQECSVLVVAVGFSEKSMFPNRPWSLDWLTQHCQSRFQITPKPYDLVHEWGYTDLVGNNASYILFTNGLNDMWSVGSHLVDLSDTIVALNFPNGAHHSDLSHVGPSDADTDDIKDGFKQISSILEQWLNEIKREQQ